MKDENKEPLTARDLFLKLSKGFQPKAVKEGTSEYCNRIIDISDMTPEMFSTQIKDFIGVQPMTRRCGTIIYKT